MPLSLGELARDERTFTVDYPKDDGTVEPFTITYKPGLYTAEYEEEELIPALAAILTGWSLTRGGTGKAASEPVPTNVAGLRAVPTSFLWWVANRIAEDVRADPTRRGTPRDGNEPAAS